VTDYEARIRRIKLLRRLIENLDEAVSVSRELQQFVWDSGELVVLRRSHVVGVLSAYRAGEASAFDVDRWANAIEGREDIGFEANHEMALHEAIFQLGNPGLEGILTEVSAHELAAKLSVGSSDG
jgi:hypothetical protein